MNDRWVIDEGTVRSVVLREATEKVNWIWRLAYAYRAPEHLVWLDVLTGELVFRWDFVRSHMRPSKSAGVA